MNTTVAKTGRILLALLACYGLSACSIEPWVKPYERDRLADPIMALDGDPVSTAYIQHVTAVIRQHAAQRTHGQREEECQVGD
jgi:hypothetical protein